MLWGVSVIVLIIRTSLKRYHNVWFNLYLYGVVKWQEGGDKLLDKGGDELLKEGGDELHDEGGDKLPDEEGGDKSLEDGLELQAGAPDDHHWNHVSWTEFIHFAPFWYKKKWIYVLIFLSSFPYQIR